ncbi:Dscam, partial [Cordylochernes scorpioides]
MFPDGNLSGAVPARWDQRPPPQVQATEGTSVSLPCKGAGKPPPQSFWTGPRVTNGSSLVFPRVSRGDQGIYRCKVTNNVGPELEVSTFLAVHGYLKIQPFSFSNSAVIGDKISTTCSPTSDNERLTFTWLKNGKEITSGKVKVNTFEGVSTIVFNPLEEEDEGNYTCRVTSTTSGSDSFTAPLHVLGYLKIQPFSFSNSAVIGDKISTTCSPTSDNDRLTFTWLKNGKEITSGKVKVNTFEGVSMIVFNPLEEEDEGNYTCRVTSTTSGSDSFTAPLHVLGEFNENVYELERNVRMVSLVYGVPGGIRIQPFFFSNSAVVGDKLSTTCSPTSDNERVTFTWLKDGREISGKVKVNTFDGVSTVIFNPLTEEDEGNYTCRVTSPTLGSDSFTAPLHVLAMIQVQPFIFPRTAIVGQKTTAVCSTTSSGTERLSFTWLKEGRELDSRVKVNTMDGISNIIFTELTEEDEGNYTCRVTSPRSGSDSYTAPLHVLGRSPDLQSTLITNPALSPRQMGAEAPRPAPGHGRDQRRSQLPGLGPTCPHVSVERAAGGERVIGGVPQGVAVRPGGVQVSSVQQRLIQVQPFIFPKTAIVGQKISALCSTTSSDNERLSFTWIKDGRELGSRVKVNTMDGISTIVFAELTEEDEGNYTCRVTSPRSNFLSILIMFNRLNTCIVILLALSRLTIVRQPSLFVYLGLLQVQPFVFPKSAIVGQKITALCSITSSDNEKITFSWMKDGRTLDSKMNIFTRDGVSTLTLNNLSEEDEGNYTCKVTSPLSGSDSFTASLHVLGMLQVQPFSFPKSAIVGQKMSVLCTTTSTSNERVSFAWLKDGRDLSSHIKINTIEGISTITFSPLSEEDEGNYTCKATSPASGSDSFTAPLHVLGRPKDIVDTKWRLALFSLCRLLFFSQPLRWSMLIICLGNLKIQPFYFPTSAMVGLKVTATCSPYTASGKINFYWQKDGRDLHERIKVNTIEGVSMIVFDPLTEEDEGNYTCRGSSPSAGSDSFTAPLHVLGKCISKLPLRKHGIPDSLSVPARWEYRPPAQHQAMEGASVSLQCKGTGRPLPISLWTGPRVTNGSSLVFPRVSRGDQGIYRCKVTNNVGPELEASTFLA